MEKTYENVAEQLISRPLILHSVHKTFLQAEGRYEGHKNRRTTKPALLIALQGEAVFHFGGSEPSSLTPGRAQIGGYNRTLEIEVMPGGFEYCIIHFTPVREEQLADSDLRDTVMLEPGLTTEVRELIEQLCRLSPIPGHVEQLEKQTLFYRLLHAVLQGERARLNARGSSVVEQAVAHIHNQYGSSMTLEELAATFELKPKYFSYLFHKFTGIRPIPYLIQYRMNRAQELLLSGQASIREIASRVGYDDPYYFSRLFKKYMGVAPNSLRPARRRKSPS
ncbi:helix-turn-helix transcriptional regulator [Paenibacillus daejeonensis]|uniref:helix-turn-helix transcriptional regulator n=1 Tax=Paenibacillus daejeonensis TaxID=135193 RepID=UPI0003718D41|nr:AraC family transcriptional regulator [Paenibacillus daejeonensis]